MTEAEIRSLLAMIADHDTNPDTFNFVLKRIVGLVHGVEADKRKEDNDSTS